MYCCTAVFRSSDTRWPTRLGVGPRAQDSHAEEQQAAAQLAAAVTLIRGTLPPPFPTHACVRLLFVSHRLLQRTLSACGDCLGAAGWRAAMLWNELSHPEWAAFCMLEHVWELRLCIVALTASQHTAVWFGSPLHVCHTCLPTGQSAHELTVACLGLPRPSLLAAAGALHVAGRFVCEPWRSNKQFAPSTGHTLKHTSARARAHTAHTSVTRTYTKTNARH